MFYLVFFVLLFSFAHSLFWLSYFAIQPLHNGFSIYPFACYPCSRLSLDPCSSFFFGKSFPNRLHSLNTECAADHNVDNIEHGTEAFFLDKLKQKPKRIHISIAYLQHFFPAILSFHFLLLSNWAANPCTLYIYFWPFFVFAPTILISSVWTQNAARLFHWNAQAVLHTKFIK